MEHSLRVAWEDLLVIFEQRREVLDMNANFHEKIGACFGKMSSLEVACRETMMPMKIDAIHEFLNKFKQLRIDMLASLMLALKDGNELLAKLRETANCGRLESRPDSIKVEIKKSMTQVELWLEDLHDRRNALEQSWQTRKIQLEQCLALAILSRDLHEMQKLLQMNKESFSSIQNELDSETNVTLYLNEVISLKQDTTMIRDRALKITRSTEKLTNQGSFSGENASANAYEFLSECSEHLVALDTRENLLSEMKEFFMKADRALNTLRKLEEETSITTREQLSQKRWVNRMLNEISSITDEPLRLGYGILDRIGRSSRDAFGVERLVAELESRKTFLEDQWTQNNQFLRITESLHEFNQCYDEINAWLVSVNKAFLQTNNALGPSLHDSKTFMRLHHQLLSDLQKKGIEINELLTSTSHIVDEFEESDRKDIDRKVQMLHDTWSELRTIVESRVDLVTVYIRFLQTAEHLTQMFARVEEKLRTAPEERKMAEIDGLWNEVRSIYGQLKNDGNTFIANVKSVKHK